MSWVLGTRAHVTGINIVTYICVHPKLQVILWHQIEGLSASRMVWGDYIMSRVEDVLTKGCRHEKFAFVKYKTTFSCEVGIVLNEGFMLFCIFLVDSLEMIKYLWIINLKSGKCWNGWIKIGFLVQWREDALSMFGGKDDSRLILKGAILLFGYKIQSSRWCICNVGFIRSPI